MTLAGIGRDVPAWNAVVLVALGALLVFAGYRSMRLTARLSATILFAAVGLLAGVYLEKPLIGIAAAAILGGLGYALGDLLYFVNMALNGAGAGSVIAAAVCLALGKQAGPLPLAAGALAGAILALVFERGIGIFGTSVLGAALVAVGAGSLAAVPPLAVLGMFVGLTALGCFTQAATTRTLPPRGAAGRPASA
jgi:hypothetical protein